MSAEEHKLSVAGRRLEAKVEAFQLRKEAVKAAYTAARVHASIAEAFAGICGPSGWGRRCRAGHASAR